MNLLRNLKGRNFWGFSKYFKRSYFAKSGNNFCQARKIAPAGGFAIASGRNRLRRTLLAALRRCLAKLILLLPSPAGCEI